MTHTLLKGTTLYNGVSQNRGPVDIRLHAGVVAEVGRSLEAAGARVLDLRGRWTLPGFVDAHSHADASVITGREMERRALSGVTTEIVGQDGLGLPYIAQDKQHATSGILTAIAGPIPGHYWDVSTYLTAVDDGAFARTAVLAPHGTIRAAILGRSLEEASFRAREHMNLLVKEALLQGACGVSTGLSYPPAFAADTDELIDVMSGLPAGTPYVTHLRSYGDAFEDALHEAREVTDRSGTSLHLSHLHISGSGRAGAAPKIIESILAGSPDATWDSYPYLAGCTFLTAVLPSWAQERELTDLLGNPQMRQQVIEDLNMRGPGPTVATGWHGIVLTGLTSGALSGWERKDVAAVVKSTKLSPGEVIVRAIDATAGQSCVLVPQGHLDNVVTVASFSQHMVGSDGIFGSGAPHPRLESSFLRFLAWALEGIVPFGVDEAVARMTSRPATRFGLPVGKLDVGDPADVVIIDPMRLSPGSELESGVPEAVTDVFINGEETVRNGSWLGRELRGLGLRRKWKKQ